jgi:3-oxoacyl-[acyl-carrier-protein] synthase-3
MAYLRGFGCYLPSRVMDNAELAPLVGVDPAWILQATGIEQRRYAAPEETVAGLGAKGAADCLQSAGLNARDVGLLIAASGSGERRFPGPAAAIGRALGVGGVPAIDLPMASAGSLFGMSLAARLSRDYGNVLVVASEIMSRVVRCHPAGRDTAILFGDGAGACLVGAGFLGAQQGTHQDNQAGFAEIADSIIYSDGEFGDALRLDLDSPIHMEGRTIILQAARKIPRTISELLQRNQLQPAQVDTFLMHQANLNLIARVAQALSVPESRFFCNVARYGNTSSASMLIAAAEWWRQRGGHIDGPIVFAAFGAGLHWGALLATPFTNAIAKS